MSGGAADDLNSYLQGQFRSDMPLADAIRLGLGALERASDGASTAIPPENLEVCVLEKSRTGRKFRRVSHAELRSLLQV